MVSPDCQNCGKPTEPVFATRVNGGLVRAWYCRGCHSWMPPIFRERRITQDEWDTIKPTYQGARHVQ